MRLPYMCTWLVTSVTKSNVLRHLVVGGKDFCFSHSTTCAWLLSAAQCKRVGTQGGVHQMTPLHMAAEKDHSKIVEYLVDEGADVNIQDHNKVKRLF